MCALPQAAVAAAIKVPLMQREPGTGQRQRANDGKELPYLGAPAHNVLRLDRRAGGANIAAERQKS